MFPFDDVIMLKLFSLQSVTSTTYTRELIEAEWRIYASVQHTNIASDKA